MIAWLERDTPFPPVEQALDASSDACGLLAASAGLSAERLICAYRRGIFPWYAEGQPVLWWSPDPRMVLCTREFRVSSSLRKTLRRALRDDAWEIRVDHDFEAMMHQCATAPRQGQPGTWITAEVIHAYCALHRAGLAHSVEAWHDGQCAGGLYGVSMGRMFFGESMCAHVADASKIALAALVAYLRQHRITMIDCQQRTAHLASLGAREITREAFVRHVRESVDQPSVSWHFDKTALNIFC